MHENNLEMMNKTGSIIFVMSICYRAISPPHPHLQVYLFNSSIDECGTLVNTEVLPPKAHNLTCIIVDGDACAVTVRNLTLVVHSCASSSTRGAYMLLIRKQNQHYYPLLVLT